MARREVRLFAASLATRDPRKWIDSASQATRLTRIYRYKRFNRYVPSRNWPNSRTTPLTVWLTVWLTVSTAAP